LIDLLIYLFVLG